MSEKDSKTEKATPRRRSKARSEGQVATSREVTGVAVLAATGLALYIVLQSVGHRMLSTTTSIFGGLDELVWSSSDKWLTLTVTTVAYVMLPIAGLGLVAALLAGFAQTGGNFTTEALGLKFDRLNPIPQLKRLFFSKQTIFSLLQSIGKVVVIGGATAHLFIGEMPAFSMLSQKATPVEIVEFMIAAMIRLAIRVGLLFVVFAIIDWVLSKRRYEEQIKMSKDEVRRDYKDQEGDPQIRSRRRAKQRELSKARMMSEVPKADVIVVNPTHYAVALRYDTASMAAPRVTAKGVDEVAARIREIARGAGVPVVHNPPLARGLFAAVDPGGEVPQKFYVAVAEVLAFVYRIAALRRRRPALPQRAAVGRGRAR